VNSRKASGKKLTKEQKAQVGERNMRGQSPGDIAREMGLDPMRVSGTVRALINAGHLPPNSGGGSSSNIGSPAMNTPFGTPVPVPPQIQSDGYAWSQMPTGQGGFAHPSQVVKYVVERYAPQNEGMVGWSATPPSDDEVAQKYGQGSYRISKQVPGKLPESRELTVSAAFGRPRYPNQQQQFDAPVAGRPPVPGPRPWAAQAPGFRDEGSEDPGQQRPPFSRQFRYPGYGFEDRDRDRDRALSDFARQASGTESSIAVAVVDKLSNLQEKTLQRMEAQSARGPDTFVRDFYKEQTEYQHRISEEERRKTEAKQEEERKREEQRRRDDEERWRRWQSEADERHRRDMERIKEERQTLLDLEAKKLDLIREESKAREGTLRKEIESYSKRVEEVQAQSEARIEEMQESLKEDLGRGRSTLEREFEIREKALDNEHGLRQEMIKLREEMIKTQGQDDMTRMLGQLVDGVKETVGKVVELKKFEMASPEDRAAAIAHGGGNIHEVPAAAQASLPATPVGSRSAPAAPKPQAARAAAGAAPGGNGATPGGGAEQAIQEGLKSPIAQHILSEWGLALQNGKDPALFVNSFMEWMKDETPAGAEGRKACAAFAQLMDNRDWLAMKRLIAPSIPADAKKSFDGDGADRFYNAFRVMVCESVRDYWQMYLAEKQRMMQERSTAQHAAAEAAQAPAPVLPAAEDAPAAVVDEEAPVEDVEKEVPKEA